MTYEPFRPNNNVCEVKLAFYVSRVIFRIFIVCSLISILSDSRV